MVDDIILLFLFYRHSGGKYLPSDIDPSLCTHIIYGFAVLDNDELIIRPHDPWADFDNCTFTPPPFMTIL